MISLIDVANYIDEKNMPVGHGLKLLKEMPKLFGEKTEIFPLHFLLFNKYLGR